MFFEPPKVKSLSRYGEFGVYLGNRHFLLMLGIAFTLHIAFIAIYSMVPAQEIIKIPVRVLNIKLSGGSSANGIHMPAATPTPVAQAPAAQKDAASAPAEDEMKSVGENDAETAVDDAIKAHEAKPAVSKKHTAPTGKVVVHKETKKPVHAHSVDSLATPKKYVREADTTSNAPKASVKAASGTGNGSTIGGEAGGSEVINRYTQLISQAIKNHQSFARATYRDASQEQSRINGQVVMRIRIDRDGHIIYSSVDRTSGNEMVDQVAKAMVQASDPLPAVPSDYPSDSQLEFLIAVQVDFAKQ